MPSPSMLIRPRLGPWCFLPLPSDAHNFPLPCFWALTRLVTSKKAIPFQNPSYPMSMYHAPLRSLEGSALSDASIPFWSPRSLKSQKAPPRRLTTRYMPLIHTNTPLFLSWYACSAFICIPIVVAHGFGQRLKNPREELFHHLEFVERHAATCETTSCQGQA